MVLLLCFFFFVRMRRPTRSTQSRSSAASDVYKRQEQAGLIGLFVDAKDERAHKFYERYGFVSLPGHVLQLFLPLETLRLTGIK